MQAKTAMDWYSRGMKLNPYDGFNYMGCGMCLDWLERHDEAETCFNHADALDPQRLFCRREHRLALRPGRRYAAARPWLKRSLKLQWDQNPTATSYLNLVEQKLRDNASSKNDQPAGF